jgi:hypothetical protein
MNVELQRAKGDSRNVVDLKQAHDDRKRGDAELKTSCICCKFKPSCDEAIPFYSQAADMYKGAGMFNDELYCREKLIFCFRYTKSPEEEGIEYGKISKIYLTRLNNLELGFNNLQNAYRSYFSKAEYESAIKLAYDIGDIYNTDKNEIDYAEKSYKIAYDGMLQVFHDVVTRKKDPKEFLYRALNKYLAILIKNNKVRIAIESCEEALKVIEPVEEDKSRVVETYGFLLLALIVNEEDIKFREKVDTAKSQCRKNADYRLVGNIERLFDSIKEGNEKGFSDCMIEVNSEYPVDLCKKLATLFNNSKNKRKPSGDERDSHVVVMASEEGYL